MIMYRAHFSTNRIEAVTVEYTVQDSVKFDGRLQSRVGDYSVFCDTWEEARAALINYWTSEVKDAEQVARTYRKHLQEAQDLQQGNVSTIWAPWLQGEAKP